MGAVVLLLGVVSVLAIWLGYPAVVRQLAQGRVPAPIGAGAEPLPIVSVIVATREPSDLVQARIDNLLEAAYDRERIEIVVGAEPASWGNGSTYAGLRGALVVSGDEPGGKACNLNAAVRASRGEVLVFTDSAQRFESGTIAALVRALQHGPHRVVSGALSAGGAHNDAGLVAAYWRMERALRANEALVHSSVGVTGAVYGMMRELWRPLPTGLILDDLYVPMQSVLSGARVGFEPTALASDARVFTVAQEYRRKVRTLTGLYQLCALLPGVLSPARNPIFWQFLFHKLLRMTTPVLLLASAIGGVWLARDIAVRQFGMSGRTQLLVLLAGAVGLGLIPPLRRLAWTGITMQRAIVAATWNAMRGRWNVW